MSFKSLLILLFGTSRNVPKHDLRKKPTSDDAIKSLNEFLQRNFYIICVLAIIFLLIVFVIVCYAIVGVSATESGVTYNAMDRII
jgi:ABC-type multidrug transport system permease subunit